MNWKNRLKYIFQYIPVTLHALLFALVTWLSYKILYKPLSNNTEEELTNSFQPFILLMGKLVFWLILVLTLVSVLSTIAAWLYFLWLHKKRNTGLEISFELENNKGRRRLLLKAAIKGAFRPILGFVKARLLYNDYGMTDKFALLSGRRKINSIFREGISGTSHLILPDIREYQVNAGFIYFEDMLQIISLPIKQHLNNTFFQPPLMSDTDEINLAPKKTETQELRIDQLRRVEGEYLNYKSFESGDDIRRIVWKVYAKNRDLVVRTPERLEPFASHVYFYASFYATIKSQWVGDAYLDEMLNYYKNNIWAIYKMLSAKDWSLRYIPDQQFSINENLDEEQKAERIISISSWQTDVDLNSYFNHRTGSILIISSLSDIPDLANLLDIIDKNTVVYYIKLSKVFQSSVALNWISRLLLVPKPDRLSRLRGRWFFSPLRLQILKKEKEIEALLDSRY